jgi:hypothetical protein
MRLIIWPAVEAAYWGSSKLADDQLCIATCLGIHSSDEKEEHGITLTEVPKKNAHLRIHTVEAPVEVIEQTFLQ